MLLHESDVQDYLKRKGFYLGPIDGLVGIGTRLAIDSFLRAQGSNIDDVEEEWTPQRKRVAVEQWLLAEAGADVGDVDGYVGPQTKAAFEQWIKQDRERSSTSHLSPAPTTRNVWPREAEMFQFYGQVGQRQTQIVLPYPHVIAWNPRQVVTKMTLHERCADSALKVLTAVYRIYGDERIREFGLNLYGGSLNVRKKRGGTSWSMHAWGAAIDYDPEHNALNTPYQQARFSAPEYNDWWACWKAEGWFCLGPDRGYDTMHVQAARP